MKAIECRPKLIPIEAAAQVLGTTALNVLMQIKRGRLAGEEVDGSWYVTAESLARPTAGKGVPDASVACREGHCRGCSSGR